MHKSRSSRARPLDERDVDPDPFAQFSRWFEEARQAVRLPEAMTLATATSDGAPSARVVLLKGVDERGFVFFTNYGSRKGADLAANPRAALVLYWDPLGRQVRVEGRVARVPSDEAELYFTTRPRGAQLSAWASRQSAVVESRAALEERVAELAREFGDGLVPLPPFWGGFRVVPETIELWQHREDRLHDRLRYRRDEGGGWLLERLAP